MDEPTLAVSAKPSSGLVKGRSSPIQQRFYRLREQHASVLSGPPFRNTRDWMIAGKLDLAALTASVSSLFLRQWSLRSVFTEEGDGVSTTVLGPSAIPELEIHDLRDAAPSRLQAIVQELYTRPIDLGRDCPAYGGLLVLGDDRYRLIFTFDHIAHDGKSVRLVTTELWMLYDALRINPRADPDEVLGALSHQYQDWANHQWQLLESEYAGRLREFWRTRLEDGPALVLPEAGGLAEPARPEAAFATSIAFDLSPQVVAFGSGVRTRTPQTRRQEVLTRIVQRPLFFLSALFALLHRTTGQRDLCLVVPSDSRPREVSQVIGLFTIPLLVRVQLDEGITFRDLFVRVRDAFSEVQLWQRVPLYTVFTPRSDQARVAFNYQRITPLPRVSELTIARAPNPFSPEPVCDMDLQLLFFEDATAQSVRIDITGRRACFQRDALERLGRAFVAFWPRLLAAPERPIAELSIDSI